MLHLRAARLETRSCQERSTDSYAIYTIYKSINIQQFNVLYRWHSFKLCECECEFGELEWRVLASSGIVSCSWNQQVYSPEIEYFEIFFRSSAFAFEGVPVCFSCDIAVFIWFNGVRENGIKTFKLCKLYAVGLQLDTFTSMKAIQLSSKRNF